MNYQYQNGTPSQMQGTSQLQGGMSMPQQMPAGVQQMPYPNMPMTGGMPYPQQQMPDQAPIASAVKAVMEQSYIENILRQNRGKTATIYMNFENSQWGSKIFRGRIIGAGKDHIILADLQTNMVYMLLMIYLNYVTFDEPISYYYPYSNGVPQNRPDAENEEK